MPQADRGEVWLVDLGLAAEVRPCLVMSVPFAPPERSLLTLIPHTTSVRGTRFEIIVPKPFLKTGAFYVQGVVTVAPPRLIRRLGRLEGGKLSAVEDGLRQWLKL